MAKRDERASGDYAVGWGKPPVANRFSATNQPKGRNAAFALNRKPAHELECEKVTLRRNGQPVEMPLREAIDRALVQKAFSNVTAARKLYAVLDAEEDAQAAQASPLSARELRKIQELLSTRLRTETDRLRYFANNGLLEKDRTGQWKVKRWVRQAAMMRPATG